MREIKANFVLGGHKAYGFAKVAAEKKVWPVSSLNEDESSLIWAKKAATVQGSVDAVLAEYGPKTTCGRICLTVLWLCRCRVVK
ncbi:MAG: hypothetical protein LBV65_02950 [Desulfovibrio sp.]|jgi:hypothetical protein|nr:hypothetical protein [Desulfovibrio sp.]